MFLGRGTQLRDCFEAAVVLAIASAIVFALGAVIADPIIGLAITLVILRITWDSWRTVSTTDPGKLVDVHEHD
jgi:divalent metal cation (Fe/Co/Zn/Cd) transporter